MKLNKLIPGNNVTQAENIMREILNQLNPNKKENFESFKSWSCINENAYNLELLKKSESFYVMYIHPVHAYMNKLFDTKNIELLEFMHTYIDYDKGTGIDIIISTKDYAMILVCNHDGEIYQAK